MDKSAWIDEFKLRIRRWVVRVLKFCDTIPLTTASKNIIFQLSKSSSSTGANHSAACRARSKNEFFSKMSIAVEESDESVYWLTLIKDMEYKVNENELSEIIAEGEEITKILAKGRATVYNDNK